MTHSFYNGVSGIKTHQFGIDVTADNISNINNVGFRGSRGEFSTILSQNLTQAGFAPTTNQVGMGSTGQTTAIDIKQGSLVPTDNTFDLAIQGSGMFGVQSQSGEILYTRNGAFIVDRDGHLVDTKGRYVMGTPNPNVVKANLSEDAAKRFGQIYKDKSISLTDAYTAEQLAQINLKPVQAQQKLKIPTFMYLPSTPTTNVSIRTNLNPTLKKDFIKVNLHKDDIVSNLDKTAKILNINGTINNTKELQDPKEGDKVLIKIKDAKNKEVEAVAVLQADKTWQIKDLKVDKLDLSKDLVVNANLLTKQEISNKQNVQTAIISPKGQKNTLDITFTKRVPQPQSGSIWDAEAKVLSKENKELSKEKGEFVFDGNGQLVSHTLKTIDNEGSKVNLNFGKSSKGASDSISAFPNDKVSTKIEKDGKEEGFLKRYGMDRNGNIIAQFDNATNISLGKVALYHFQNEQGLHKASSNLYKVSSNSGAPIFYTDKDGNFIYHSTITSKKLEMSNVKLASALTELILLQKGYDASAKSVTTSDQMLQRAIEMKK